MSRAAFLVRPQLTLVREIKLSKPEGNQVLVRLQGCGICESNLSVWEGRPWFVYPREAGAPGHEGWGIVEAVGDAVTDIDVGERVAMLSGHAYAEFDIAPRDRVIALPEELDDEPFPADSCGRAISIFHRSGIRSGHSVAIVGDGLVELLLAQLAADAGAYVVMLSDRSDALQLAESMDADQTLEMTNDGQDRRRAMELSAGRGFDCVIELTGRERMLELATAIVAENASLVTDANPSDVRRLRAPSWDGRDIQLIHGHEPSMTRRIADVQKAIEAALLGRLDPFPLLTHTVSLNALDQGFHMLRQRPAGFVKALMVNEKAA
jgi:threonine dehydrogenase-like Zn-dependent dehydrogenase